MLHINTASQGSGEQDVRLFYRNDFSYANKIDFQRDIFVNFANFPQ